MKNNLPKLSLKLLLILLLSVNSIYALPPTITSFTPISAKPGDVVTLTGTNFNTTAANNIVFFGATRAIVTGTPTTTSLTVTVPTGANYAPITLLNTATHLVCYSRVNFTPKFSPAKSGIIATDFSSKVDFSTGLNSQPYSAAIGDLDGDGKPDIAVVNSSAYTVSVYYNTATSGSISVGSFAAPVNFTTGTGANSITIGDLDGDGKLDLVIANGGSDKVSVYRNTSTSGSIGVSSFASKVDFATGLNSFPYSVAIGDLDGDGKPDLATANGNSSNVSVLRNTSTSGSITSSSFAAKVNFTTGSSPQSIAIGDLDGDSKPDLAIANWGSDNVSVLRNTATSGSIVVGSFAAKVDFSTGTQPNSIAIGDLDGDGKPDLAVANNGSDNVSVLRNTATSGSIVAGSFAAKVNFTTGSYSYSVTLGDLDGDGKPDLASANQSSSNVSVLRNTSISGSISAGSFATKVDFTTGTFPTSIAIGDLDGDGRPDMALANTGSDNFSVLRNADILSNNANLSALSISSGTLNPSFSSATVSYTASVTNATSSVTVTPTKTDANASIQVRVNAGAYASVSSGIASGALSLNVGSNSIDVKVTAQDGTTIKIYTITVTRAFPVPSISSFTPISAKPGDVVTLTGTNFNTTAINNIVFFGATKASVSGTPTTTSMTVIVPSGATYAPITLLNTGSSLACYSLSNFIPKYNPAKTGITSTDFTTNVDFTIGATTRPYSVAIGDLDGDGKPDLAVVNQGLNTISIYRNTASSGSISTGSFAAPVDFATGTTPRSVSIGDLDGDGKPDLAVANRGDNSVSILRNTSTSGSISAGSFATKVDFSTGLNTYPQSVTIGDLDGDGKLDLAVANIVSMTVSIFRNTAASGSIVSSSFAAPVDFATSSGPASVALGDLDGDGKPELAVANFGSSSNTVSVFRNTTTSGSINIGSFATKVDFTTGATPTSVIIGDLDSDGKPDLAVANRDDYTVSILRNTSTSGSIGAGSFATKVDFATGISPNSIAIGDLDGDGKPDLALANLGSDNISILHNTAISGSISAGSFATTIDFTTGTQPYSVAIGDLDGDGRPDLATANWGSNSVSVLRNADLLSNNANLLALGISSGSLSPGFSASTLAYTASLSNNTSSVSFTPTKSDANAICQIRINNGSYSTINTNNASSALSLNVGSNTIDVTVTAQDGTTIKTYSITVTRALPPPNITSFTPTSGTVGSLVTITGTDLNNLTDLYLGGVPAITVSNTGTDLVAMVMPGATIGTISVGTSGGSIQSSSSFTVIASIPPAAQQGNKLVGSGNVGDAYQGASVAVSADGNTAIVGGDQDDGGQGAAWVYARSGNIWTQQSKLIGIGNLGAAGLGISVALSADGNTAIVGGFVDNAGIGAAWVYTRSAGIWSQQGSKLVGTGNIGRAYQGSSVSLSADGNTALVGGWEDNSEIGAVWVYTRSGGVWSQQGSKLVGTGSVGQAFQGQSVSISADGNTAIVGGNQDYNGKGAVWVYTRSGGIWSQQGNKLLGTGYLVSNQGRSVNISADGNTAIVGGSFVNNSSQGAAWVFTRNGGVWSQQGNKLVGTGSVINFFSDLSVSISADGNTAIVGEGSDNNNQGAVWVYTRNAGIWSQQGSKIVGKGSIGTNISLGHSVSISADGNTSIVGGNKDNIYQGAVWAFNGVRSNNASLSALGISSGSLSPSFSTSTLSYSAGVSNNTSSVSFTPTKSDTNATCQLILHIGLNSSYIFNNVFSSLPLNVGSNIIDIKVTADDGTSMKTYSTIVTRAASNNADLSSFALSSGSLSPSFTANTLTYTASVVNATASITLTPTVAEANAIIQVRVNNGTYSTVSSGSASGALSLNVGSNTIDITVTAQDGTSIKTYTTTITRAGAGNSPTITSFTPASGSVGSLVTITGTDLNNLTNLLIGGVPAITVSNTGTDLVAMVMPGTTTGYIGLTNSSGSATSTSNFVVTPSIPPAAQQGNKLVGTGVVGFALQAIVSLSADGNTAIVGGIGDDGANGAVWIYTRSGALWSQQGNKLVGTGNIGAAWQGYSVALSADGNTAVVGGIQDDNGQGAVWIFTRTANNWSQQGNKLVGTGGSIDAKQGTSVSLSADGSTALVGGIGDSSGQGAVWVFTRNGINWTQQGGKLVGTGSIIYASSYNINQGQSVALSADGNTAIVGGSGDDFDKGATWVFVRNGNTWTQQGSKMIGSNSSGAAQGYSVSLSADGNTALVGGYRDNYGQGAAWVFVRSGSNWTQLGNKITGSGYYSYCGQSVSLSADGNTALMGGWHDNNLQGATWLFTRSGNTWTQQGNKIIGSGGYSNASQGYSVSLSADGNTSIVGGYNDNNGQGAVWVFNGSSTNSQTQLTLTAFLEGSYLGNGSMTAAPFSADGISPMDIADTITIELHQSGGSHSLEYSSTGLLNTTGLTTINFPSSTNGKYYYIVVKHRNSIETWSADSVLLSNTGTTYDFSSFAAQSFGDNMSVDVNNGLHLIYSGDINQDGAVDFNDYPNLDISSSNGVLGYDSNDLNGDASVDFNDYPILDINSSNGVLSITP